MDKRFTALLAVVFFLGFMVRAANFSFPAMTADEARIAWRGSTLAATGKDELGRSFPVVFNGLEDYQLPVASYVTALGITIFGKSDLGARFFFLVMGVAVVFLTYKVAFFLSRDRNFGLLSALLVAFSPPLIFLSKVPNETIVLTFLLLLLFSLLTGKKVRWVGVFLILTAAELTSKNAWFLLPPFVFFTLYFYQVNLNFSKKLAVTGLALIFSAAAVLVFLHIPQSTRSLLENNFSIFSDITIKNGIDRLRGQGIESGWPAWAEKAFFNRLLIFPVGFLHWLSALSPVVYFGQFEPAGKLSFIGLGAWAKVLLLPFLLGLGVAIRRGAKAQRTLLLYPLVLTFPVVFIYPALKTELVVLTLPFLALVICWGLSTLSGKWQAVILTLAVLEVGVNLFNLTPQVKNANALRPGWVSEVALAAARQSPATEVVVSDDIVDDFAPFFGWYIGKIMPGENLNIPFPYRLRQTSLSNITLQGFDESVDLCGTRWERGFFLSRRGLKMLEDRIDTKTVKPAYFDSLGQGVVYYVSDRICQK